MPLLPPSAPREARNSFVSALGFLAENAGPRFQNLSELASYQNKRLSPVPVHVFGLSTLAESRPLQMQSSPSHAEIWSFFVTGPEIPAAILEIARNESYWPAQYEFLALREGEPVLKVLAALPVEPPDSRDWDLALHKIPGLSEMLFWLTPTSVSPGTVDRCVPVFGFQHYAAGAVYSASQVTDAMRQESQRILSTRYARSLQSESGGAASASGA